MPEIDEGQRIHTRSTWVTKNLPISDVLLDHGECRKTRGRDPITPAMETVPPSHPIVSVGIMHEFWGLARSEEPMVRVGVLVFVFKLDEAWYIVNPA